MDVRLLTLALGLVCVGMIVAVAVVVIVLIVVRKGQGLGDASTTAGSLLDAWERASPEERQALLEHINQRRRS